jgi:hypothetical protein
MDFVYETLEEFCNLDPPALDIIFEHKKLNFVAQKNDMRTDMFEKR